MKEYLAQNSVPANLSIILDSSWFINFKGDLEKVFGGETNQSSSDISNFIPSTSNTEENLLDIISWNEPCKDIRHFGSPCCVSAYCIISNPAFYPKGVPIFAIISLYDVFLLGASLRGLVALASDKQSLEPGYALNFLRTIAEYGGEMNSTLAELNHQVDFFSSYVTGCFQHIYLTTSSLWGQPGNSLFGESLVELGSDIGAIRYIITLVSNQISQLM